MDVNGSVREGLMTLSPSSYTGVDLASGPGVDEVCSAAELAERFGPDSFDIVVSTEMLEHVLDWRRAVRNLKAVLKPGGALLITTRSPGYPYHGYPHDFWRFDEDDFRAIFSDMDIRLIARDPLVPGIFIKAAKPSSYSENDLSGLALFSIISGKRELRVSAARIALFRLGRAIRTAISYLLPQAVKEALKKVLRKSRAPEDRTR